MELTKKLLTTTFEKLYIDTLPNNFKRIIVKKKKLQENYTTM